MDKTSIDEPVKQSGKKNDISSRVKIDVSEGEAPTTQIDPKDYFDLLKVVTCHMEDRGEIVWDYPDLAARLLRSAPADIALTREAWCDLIHPEDRRDYSRLLKSLGWEGARYTVQYRLKTDDARDIWVEESAIRVNDKDERPIRVKATMQDITHLKAKEARSLWLAQHDTITALPNKSTFLKDTDRLIGLSQRLSIKGAVIQIRINNLDNVNLIYGFEAGDNLLRAVAERLRKVIRMPDCLSKAGPRDFLLSVLGVQGQDADVQTLSQRLRRALSEQPYLTPQGRISADIKIGYTNFPQTGRDAAAFLAQTERAISYDAQEMITAYSPIMGLPNAAVTPTSFTKDDIIAALNEDRISLAYQPIIHARHRNLNHYECLLRLRQSDGALVSAGRLILASEKLGLVHLLDRHALKIARQTLEDNPDIKLALNVSAQTLQSDETAEDYIEALKDIGPLAQRVTLELTETAALNDPAKASDFSNETRALGCEFAIDDFGSGFTSFQNLMAIEAEYIKIDGSLVQGVSTTPHMQTFIRMMVDLAQTFSVKTVAEMVEDPADADVLKRLGVDYLQGYLFGRPNATPDFSAP